MQVSSSPVSLPRRERERSLRRATMLEAARQVFGEKGFAGSTLDEIALRAEFGKGTLYNYFPGGKEELLFAVIDAVYDELCGLIERAFPADSDAPAREQFQRFLELCFDHFSSNRAVFAILMKEAYRMALSDREERVRYFIRQRGRVASTLAVPIQRAMDRGELRPLPAQTVAHLLLGNLQGCQMLLSVNECSLEDRDTPDDRPSWTPKEAAHFLSVMLFDGLLADSPRAIQDSDRES